MAKIVATTVGTVLIGKLVSGDSMKLAQSVGIDFQLKKLEKTLPMIHVVLTDAAQKHTTQITGDIRARTARAMKYQ